MNKNAQNYLKGRAAALKALKAARAAFIVARNACSAAKKEYDKFVIPRPKRGAKAAGKKGRRG